MSSGVKLASSDQFTMSALAFKLLAAVVAVTAFLLPLATGVPFESYLILEDTFDAVVDNETVTGVNASNGSVSTSSVCILYSIKTYTSCAVCVCGQTVGRTIGISSHGSTPLQWTLQFYEIDMCKPLSREGGREKRVCGCLRRSQAERAVFTCVSVSVFVLLCSQ